MTNWRILNKGFHIEYLLLVVSEWAPFIIVPTLGYAITYITHFNISFVPVLLKYNKFKLKTQENVFFNKPTIIHSLFSVKPENVRLSTSAIGNQACLGSYLNFTCTVSSSANPPVFSYQLLKNDVVVDTNSSGMWIRMPSSSGDFSYKCVAKNTVGTANSPSVNVTVGGKYEQYTNNIHTTNFS